MADEMENVLPFNCIKPLPLELKKTKSLAVVSSDSKQNVNTFMNAADSENIFNTFETGVNIFGKSSLINRIMNAAWVRKEETICISDQVRDICAAEKIGVRIICVGRGHNSRKLIEKNNPDYIVSMPCQIPKLILKFDLQ